MPVSKAQQSASLVDRKIESRSLGQLIVVEIPAVGSKISRVLYEIEHRCYTDTSENWRQLYFIAMEFFRRRIRSAGRSLHVQMPGRAPTCLRLLLIPGWKYRRS